MQDRIGIAGTAHTRSQPGVAVHLDARLQLQSARACPILRRCDHAPLLDDLKGVDREDRLCPRLHLDRPAVSSEAQRVPDGVAVHAQRDDGSAAHEGPSGREVGTPCLVREVLVRRNVDIGAIKPHGYIAGHLVGAPDQREAISAVQVTVILHVVVHATEPRLLGPMPQEFHGIDTSRRDHGGGLAVRVRQVRQNDRPTLGVAAVGPVRHRHLQCPAHLGLARTVGTPGHDGLLQAEQGQVPEHMLAVLLGGIDDRPAIARDAGAAGELFRVRKEMAPLGLQDVHDIEILAPCLGVAPLRGEKVNVRVAAEPAPGVHVAPALQPQRQLLLTRRDRHPRPYRLVFKATSHVDRHLATRQPALARAIDVGVADAAEPDVSADVDMPGVHI